MIPYPIELKLLQKCRLGRGVNIPNLKKIVKAISVSDTSGQNLGFFLRFFFSSSTSFRTLCKIRHKTRMRAPIGLKFGTLKGLIKANLSTKFGRNPMNIHGVMTNYLRKIRSKVCHAHRVKRLKE